MTNNEILNCFKIAHQAADRHGLRLVNGNPERPNPHSSVTWNNIPADTSKQYVCVVMSLEAVSAMGNSPLPPKVSLLASTFGGQKRYNPEIRQTLSLWTALDLETSLRRLFAILPKWAQSNGIDPSQIIGKRNFLK